MSKLTDREAATLRAWEDYSDLEFSFLPFRTIATRSGQPEKGIRRIVRSLARKGMVQFQRGLWTEDGVPAGSGYSLTEAGRSALKQETRDV